MAAMCGHVYCQQCISAQLEGGGQEDEFLCCSCQRVVKSADVFSPAALEAADGAHHDAGEGRSWRFIHCNKASWLCSGSCEGLVLFSETVACLAYASVLCVPPFCTA